jgi:hypothetical protein
MHLYKCNNFFLNISFKVLPYKILKNKANLDRKFFFFLEVLQTNLCVFFFFVMQLNES